MHILVNIAICGLASLILLDVDAQSARAAERDLYAAEHDLSSEQQSEAPMTAAEVPLLSEGLSGIPWLVALTVILLTAFRLDIWRTLNQAIFLWTAQLLSTAHWQGVPVPASGYRRRHRRRRSSRWTWKSRSRGSNWSPGLRPSRRRSRHRNQARRRTASRPRSTGSSAPSYRRGGREYVVADFVFTHNGSVPESATPPVGGLLTFSKT